MKLLELFKTLSLSPSNTEKLKGLILKLAVEGKLTQKWRVENPNVEPASVLLERIEQEKQQLIEEKRIKKEKELPVLTLNEEIKSLPKTWVSTRLGNIGDWGAGSTPLRSNNEFYNGNINWFKSGELNNGIIDYNSEEMVTKEALERTSLRMNNPGDVLIAMYGATIGKTGLLNVSGTTNQAVCACTPFKCISSTYLHLLLKALKQTFFNQGEGGAQPNISRVKIRTQVFAMPPLEEQKAIVEIVKELLNEVEQLETLTKERIKLKEDFVESALSKLTSSEDTSQEWNYLAPHFKIFFTEKKSVKSLRETILQLAVQGKLTKKWREENPNVEPASVLLERIEQEKQQLIEEKKIKKEKSLPQIKDEDKPYKVPQSWVWCRMGNITAKLGAGSTPSGGKTVYVQEGIMFFRSQNIHNHYLKLQEVAYIPKATHEKMKGSKVNPKDLLLNITGGSIGRCALISDNFDTANVSQHVAIVRMIELETRKYIHQFIISPGFQDRIMEVQVGVSREGLSMTKLKLFPVPMPPLEEQKVIVEKVNSLMTLCDELEKQIINSETQIELLMKSCLEEALEI